MSAPLSPTTINVCSVQLTFWDSIFLTLTATVPKLFTVIPQCNIIKPLRYTEYTVLFCPFTLIFGTMHTPCHNDLLTEKSKGACGSPSWSLARFTSSATHCTSVLSGLWMTCLTHYLTPAVVRSATQVWPQGLCLWKWLQLLFLLLNVPWRIKHQHTLLSQEHVGPSSTTLPTSPS